MGGVLEIDVFTEIAKVAGKASSLFQEDFNIARFALLIATPTGISETFLSLNVYLAERSSHG